MIVETTFADAVTGAFAQAWIAPLGRALLESLWQGAAIGVAAWFALAALRDAKPQTRYAIACFALLACLLAPLSALWRYAADDGARTATMHAAAIETRIGAPTDLSAIAPNTTVPSAAVSSLSTMRTHWSASIDAGLPWIVAGWSIGVLFMLLRLCAGAVWVRRLRNSAAVVVDAALLARFETLRLRMRVGPGVRLRAWTCDTVASLRPAIGALIGPLAAGVVAPVVIVPTALIARMPVDLLEALIAHELAHIRRRDYLVNLLQTLVETLLFYYPAVWWLSRRIRHERELVADALAAAAIGAPRTLALALAELDRLRAEDERAARTTDDPSAFPITLSLAAHGGSLMSRIQHLIAPKRPAFSAGIALPSIGLIAVCAACLAYAQSEQPAQPADKTIAAHANNAPTSSAARDALPRPDETAQARGATGLVFNGDALDGDAFADAGDAGYRHQGYALIRHGERGFAISGDLEHIDDIRAAKSRIDGDFVWFQRDGKPYVVRDPATLARVRAIWAKSEDSERRLEAMSREMEAKSVELEALAEGISAQEVEQARLQDHIASRVAEIRQTIEQQQWHEQQAELANVNAQIAARAATRRGGAPDAAAEREIAALEARSEELEAQIEAQSEAMEAEVEAKSAALEAEMASEIAPIERRVEARMEAAAKPLEALGEKMEALGEEHERIMTQVDRDIHLELERAMRENLAAPAPRGDAKQ